MTLDFKRFTARDKSDTQIRSYWAVGVFDLTQYA